MLTVFGRSPVRRTFNGDVLDREINRMFDGFFRGGLQSADGLFDSVWTPAVDLAEREDAYLVKMELPGVAKDDVKIIVEDSTLIVSGEKKREEEAKESNVHRVERSYGSFTRSFTMPTGLTADAIEATFNDGVLTITLPKAEEAKPKQIAVKVK